MALEITGMSQDRREVEKLLAAHAAQLARLEERQAKDDAFRENFGLELDGMRAAIAANEQAVLQQAGQLTQILVQFKELSAR